MSALVALIAFIVSLVVYTVACYFILRWMWVAQLDNWADHMEPFYKPKFVAGIRYAARVVAGTAHEPEGIRFDAGESD